MNDDRDILFVVGELQTEERQTRALIESMEHTSRITWQMGEADLGRATDRLIDALRAYDAERSRTVMRRLRELNSPPGQ